MIVRCAACAKLLQRAPSHVRHTIFCSRGCRSLFARKPIACRGCGNAFARDPKEPRRQYCTWSCFKSSRHVTLVCSVCALAFRSYVSEHRKRADRGHVTCCSRACRNVHTSRLLGGAGTWVPGGNHGPARNRGKYWRRIRNDYMRSVGRVCEGCGAKAIHVHHLRPLSRGGELLDLDNLMAVCISCHENMHNQLRAGAFWCSFEACEERASAPTAKARLTRWRVVPTQMDEAEAVRGSKTAAKATSERQQSLFGDTMDDTLEDEAAAGQ